MHFVFDSIYFLPVKYSFSNGAVDKPAPVARFKSVTMRFFFY